jgi:hypothetical protein
MGITLTAMTYVVVHAECASAFVCVHAAPTVYVPERLHLYHALLRFQRIYYHDSSTIHAEKNPTLLAQCNLSRCPHLSTLCFD